MRLSNNNRRIIKELATTVFGNGSTVRLFGSRVDDHKRGGDIDLYIEPIDRYLNNTLLKNRLWAKLQLALGEQKIDIVISNRNKKLIDLEALSTGILL